MKKQNDIDNLFKDQLENHETAPGFESWFVINDHLKSRTIWNARSVAVSVLALAITVASYYSLHVNSNFNPEARVGNQQAFAQLHLAPNPEKATLLIADEPLERPTFHEEFTPIDPILTVSLEVEEGEELFAEGTFLDESIQANLFEALAPSSVEIPSTDLETDLPFITGLESFESNL